jgi:ubiquitin-protein ligase
MSTKRITKEFAEVSQDPPEGFTVSLPPSASIHTWHVTLAPPAGSPYHPGRYGLVLTLPAEYPFKPPIVKFVTRIYHPNVSNDSLGGICLGLLKPDVWKPSTKLRAVLEALRNLLVEPQPDDPIEDRIAEEYKNDRANWEKNVKSNVERYALSDPVFPAS